MSVRPIPKPNRTFYCHYRGNIEIWDGALSRALRLRKLSGISENAALHHIWVEHVSTLIWHLMRRPHSGPDAFHPGHKGIFFWSPSTDDAFNGNNRTPQGLSHSVCMFRIIERCFTHLGGVPHLLNTNLKLKHPTSFCLFSIQDEERGRNAKLETICPRFPEPLPLQHPIPSLKEALEKVRDVTQMWKRHFPPSCKG